MKTKLQANYKFVVLKEIPNKGVALGEVNIREGEVVSVGDKAEDLDVGDKVIFDTFKGIKYNIKGQDYWFINYETIFAII
jgi:co-chaperonin GroES (HSP10)